MYELEAKQSIQELVLKYCRAIDRRDYESLTKLYHKDSTDDHGMFVGSGKDFIAWLPEVLSTIRVTTHTVTNHLITVKGKLAEGEVYCNAYHLTKDNQESILVGRYLDKYIYEEDRWQFLHRKIVLDWNEIRPSLCDFNSPITEGVSIGASIDKDPSKDFFEFLER